MDFKKTISRYFHISIIATRHDFVEESYGQLEKKKMMFSPDQLTKVVTLLMENLPYKLFRPKAETKDYVLLVFWASSLDDSACEAQKSVEAIKQEIFADSFRLLFDVESVPALRRQVSYLVDNYVYLKTPNNDVCHLPPDNHEQLISFPKVLKKPVKKCKIDFIQE